MNAPIDTFQLPKPVEIPPTGLKSYSDVQRTVQQLATWTKNNTKYLQDYIGGKVQPVINTGTQGFGQNIAAQNSIVVSAFAHVITGSGTINTIMAPANFQSTLVLLADPAGGGFSLGTAGNIAAAATLNPGDSVSLVYNAILRKWFNSKGAGPFGANTVTAHAVIVGEGTLPVGTVGPLADGQLLIGKTGADPVAASLGAGAGIAVTPGSGTLSVANTGVLSDIAGAGISVSGATGNVTIGNTGILTVTGTPNEVAVTAGQNPTLALATDISGPNSITLATFAKLTPILFAARPGSPALGMICCFSDSTVNTWGSTIAGSGGNKVLGFFNGTNWTVFAT